MIWRLAVMASVLLVACACIWPDEPWPAPPPGECRGTDYSALDESKVCSLMFVDDTYATGLLDHCDAVAQNGADPLDFPNGGVTADPGDAPAGSPASADSMFSDGTVNVAGFSAEEFFAHDDITVGGWWKRTVDNPFLAIRKGSGGGVSRVWDIRCAGSPRRIRVAVDNPSETSPTWAAGNGTDGPPCGATDEWFFAAFTWAGVTDSGELKVYSTGSTSANSLLDCDGSGMQDCSEDTSGIGGVSRVLIWNMTAAVNLRLTGNEYEQFFAETIFTPEQMCEICRCGFRGDNTADRKAVCNYCDMGAGVPGSPWLVPPWPDL